MSEGLKCILIDKREIVNGSSAATTSMLQYEIDIPLYRLKELIGTEAAVACYQACSQAIDKLGKLAQHIDSEAGFRKKHSFYYASRKKDVANLLKEYHARQSAGFEVNWLSEQEIKHKFDLTGAYGGILSKQGASIDAFCFAHELLKHNTQKGLKIYDKTELIRVINKKQRTVAVLSTAAKIATKKIIYCTGYETTELIPEKFVELLSTFAIVSEVDETLYNSYQDLLIWNTAQPYLYMRTTDDGRFLIGGEDEPFKDPIKRDNLIDQKSHKLEKSFNKIFNKPFYCDFNWAGTFGSTKDGLPYIGEHKKFKNAYFVCGFGGNGITFSVTAMEMVSCWLNRKDHALSKCFRFGR